MRTIRLAALAFAGSITFAGPAAFAQDALKIAVGQINNWENQAPTLGEDAGIFKKHNLKIEAVGTQGAGETIQAVISGSADLGAGVGVAGVMRAFAKGAPVRILLPAFTGTGDIYWYVKGDSPIKTLQDAKPEHTIAYSTSGSTSNNIVLGFVQELGVKAKPTATGGPPATLTSVMSGQIDIGWAAPPFGVKEIKEGKIRMLARGGACRLCADRRCGPSSSTPMPGRPRRMRSCASPRRIARAVDWMYSDPKASRCTRRRSRPMRN